MARLFISPREIDFINDIAKEYMKDVVGHKIYYYSVSMIKSNVHEVYEEAINKVFDDPILIEALIEWNPEDVTTTRFGSEEKTRLSAFVHSKDMIDKKIELSEGDFFSFGEKFYEVVQLTTISNIYGQIEYKTGFRLEGREARRGQFLSQVFGPTNEKYSDDDAVQDTFVQQRGFDQNVEGVTGDKRSLIEKDVVDKPITGPAEISKKGTSNNASNAFYDES